MTDIRQQLEDRLQELRDEVKRLEAAASALAGEGAARLAGHARAARGRPRRAGASGARRSAATGARRTRRGGTRAEQAAKLVKANPGITISDLAKRMRIQPNYLYRVMPQLQADGHVVKKGKGWHPA